MPKPKKPKPKKPSPKKLSAKPARSKPSRSKRAPSTPTATSKSTTQSAPKGKHGSAGGGRGDVELIARGVLLHAGHVLLCRNLKHGYLYLPGGHVEFGESARGALEREFLEECGLRVRARSCVALAEQRFEQGGKARHELNMVFEVAPAADHTATARLFHVEPAPARGARATSLPKVRSLEPDIGFEWTDLAALASADLRPALLRAWLMSGGMHDPPTAAWLEG